MSTGKPTQGYDTEVKQRYRRKLYDFFDRASGVPVRRRTIALLDTAAALETQHALRRGYRPENIHVVNRSAAELAWVTRRCPGVVTHTAEYADFVNDVQQQFDVYNMDWCGPAFTEKWLQDIMTCAQAFRHGCVVAVTSLVGRDDKRVWAEMWEDFKEFQWPGWTGTDGKEWQANWTFRLYWIATALGLQHDRMRSPKLYCARHVVDYKFDVYRSGTQTMLWFAAKLHSHTSAVRYSEAPSAQFIRWFDAQRRIPGWQWEHTGITVPCCLRDEFDEFLRRAEGPAPFRADMCKRGDALYR